LLPPAPLCDISFSIGTNRDFNIANPELNADEDVDGPPLPAFGTYENNSKFPSPDEAVTRPTPPAASWFWCGSEYTKQLLSAKALREERRRSPPLVALAPIGAPSPRPRPGGAIFLFWAPLFLSLSLSSSPQKLFKNRNDFEKFSNLSLSRPYEIKNRQGERMRAKKFTRGERQRARALRAMRAVLKLSFCSSRARAKSVKFFPSFLPFFFFETPKFARTGKKKHLEIKSYRQ
jgi:hypothetical protein